MPEPTPGQVLRGVAAAPGVAVGPVAWLASAPVTSAGDAPGADLDVEAGRVVAAFERVTARYAAQAEAAVGAGADILFMTAALAADPALLAEAVARVCAGVPTAHAVTEAVEHYAAQLAALGGLMAERVTDLRDVGSRVVADLLGVDPPGIPDSDLPFVLAATDLAPADTASLDPDIVVGLLTLAGGPTSHTAILAKALGIPAVVSCQGAQSIPPGTAVALDGSAGTVEVAPSAARRAEVRAERKRAARLQTESTGPGHTADGHPVPLLANIGGADDARAALAAGAEGIGLFRTEFLFLNAQTAPSAAEQTRLYAEVFRVAGEHPVTVRTLDAGSDKPLPFLGLPAEENPALGMRGIRLCEVDPRVLDDQLAAIAAARAETGGRVKVMAPMVATLSEARDFVARARAAGLADAGVMVELPAAVFGAQSIAAAVDFLSVGTNDLAQYLFGADRMSAQLAWLHSPWQPALAAAVAAVVEAAGDTPVGVCGEAASNPHFACVLVGLGVSTLSTAPSSRARVRAALAGVTLDQCRAAARAARAAPTAADAAEAARLTLDRPPE